MAQPDTFEQVVQLNEFVVFKVEVDHPEITNPWANRDGCEAALAKLFALGPSRQRLNSASLFSNRARYQRQVGLMELKKLVEEFT